MEEIIKIIVEYVSIWAPSLVSILGVVVTVITALNRTKESFDNLKKDKTLKETNEKLEKALKQNEEIIETNNILIDQITKIKNYKDNLKQ